MSQDKPDALGRVASLAQLLVEQQQTVAELERELKERKAELRRTETEDLPQLMTELGLTELTLKDNSKVAVKEEVDAKITEKTRAEALKWLLDNDYGGIIKTVVAMEFGRGEHDNAAAIAHHLQQDEGLPVQLKEDVHHSTLKAFVKERLEAGVDVPFDLFNVHSYTKAIVKRS